MFSYDREFRLTNRNLLRRAAIGEQRRARTRERILQAAAQVIAKSGTDRATIDDFILAAGASRGTFYNHFESRQELLDELWRVVGRNPFLEIGRVCGAIACPVERFAASTRMVLIRATADHTWGWLIIALSASEETLTEDLRAYPLPDLRSGKHAARFYFRDERAAVDLVVGTMRAGLRALLEEPREAKYPESLCHMMLLALGVGRREASRISSLPIPAMYNQGVHRPTGKLNTETGQAVEGRNVGASSPYESCSDFAPNRHRRDKITA